MTNRPGDPRFYRLLDEIANLHARKSSDYSPGSDPLANFRASAEFGVRPYLGILTRLRDKWGRLVTMAKGGTPLNESVRDSHIDSAVYHLLAVLLLEDEAPLGVQGTFTASFGGAPTVLVGNERIIPLADLPRTGDCRTVTVDLSVTGSDDPLPLPDFGPGSPAATGDRHYAGEAGDADRQWAPV